MTLKKSQSSDPEADTLVLGLGVDPRIGATTPDNFRRPAPCEAPPQTDEDGEVGLIPAKPLGVLRLAAALATPIALT